MMAASRPVGPNRAVIVSGPRSTDLGQKFIGAKDGTFPMPGLMRLMDTFALGSRLRLERPVLREQR